MSTIGGHDLGLNASLGLDQAIEYCLGPADDLTRP